MMHRPNHVRSHREIAIDRSSFSTLPEAVRDRGMTEWEALLDAGLIGRARPLSPETLAAIAANERILLGHAAPRHREARPID